MILYLTRDDVHEMHFYLVNRTGGSFGVRDENALEPAMTFGDNDLYPTLADKASALAFSLVMNHPFVDGNKRIGHYAMETFLMMNDHEIGAQRNEQEHIILNLAAGKMEREEFATWVRKHIQPLP